MSGITVSGVISGWLRTSSQKLILITWNNCRIYQGNKEYYQSEVGEFNMLIGTKIISIAGGAKDLSNYPQEDLVQIQTSPSRSSAFSEEEVKIYSLQARFQRKRG